MSNLQSSAEKIPVLLLKTRSVPHDGYEEYFSTVEDGRYQPIFVPVLEHRFSEAALERVRDCIQSGGLNTKPGQSDARYGGIIFTSQRAVEAFSRIVEEVRKINPARVQDLLPASTPLYVVGPATARGLRELHLDCQIFGEETGNGDALAAFILDHYNSFYDGDSPLSPSKPPLLFLVGDKRRDIIPKTLQSIDLPRNRRIEVEELEIYETGEMQSFKSDFSNLWTQNNEAGLQRQWVVVFSPTGCKAMLESIGLIPESAGKPNGEVDGASPLRKTMIATIGPTTRDYLKNEFGFEPDVCAPKPSPEGVGTAIVSFMKNVAQ